MNRQQSFLPSLAPVKSTSRCADVVVPYLKKLSIGDDLAVRHQQKPPLITLKLSSTSFLNAVVNESHHYGPLYAIKTVGPATAILRRDPWQGSCKVADLRWPKHAPTRGKDKFVWQGALLKTVDGHWMATESLLKPAGIFNTRKFKIPNFSQNLKWKLVGASYQCTCSSINGLVATLEPAAGSVPPQLRIYKNIPNEPESSPSWEHHGISVLLIDYLLITSLLLVTHVHDWMSIPSSLHGIEDDVDDRRSALVATSPSLQQWRKIVHGEPIFPRTPGSPSPLKQAKVIHGKSFFPIFPTSCRRYLFPRPSLSIPSLPSPSPPSPSLPSPSDTSPSENWDDEEERPKVMPLRITKKNATRCLVQPTSTMIPILAAASGSPLDVVPPLLRTAIHRETSTSASSPDSVVGGESRGDILTTPGPHKPTANNIALGHPPQQRRCLPRKPDSHIASSASTNENLTNTSYSTSLSSLSTLSVIRRLPEPPRSIKSNSTGSWDSNPASPFRQRSLPAPPASASSSKYSNAFEQLRQRTTEKAVEAEEVSRWVQTLTQLHNASGSGATGALSDMPPPAYSSINFPVSYTVMLPKD